MDVLRRGAKEVFLYFQMRTQRGAHVGRGKPTTFIKAI
jgi:hypothetical protein